MPNELFPTNAPPIPQAQPPAAGGVPAAGLMPSGAGPGGPQPEFDEEAVTAEEQGMYDQFVLRAQQIIAKEAGMAIDQMNNSGSPVFENVGKAGLRVAQTVASTAKAKGQPISPDIMFHGGTEIVEMLMELGDAAGIFPFEQDSKEYDEVAAMALMHGAELAGNDMLASPQGAEYTAEAENIMTQGVADEVKSGQADPASIAQLQQGITGQQPG